jgi:hypothetical protein
MRLCKGLQQLKPGLLQKLHRDSLREEGQVDKKRGQVMNCHWF